jgi:glycine/D-amino acid oxidase-like deaminating enzyme
MKLKADAVDIFNSLPDELLIQIALKDPEALEELTKKLALMGCSEFELVVQKTGIRPATQDRRPFVGFHPLLEAGIFNGFGSKGVSLSPYFAKQWTDEILTNSSVHPEASIRRFYHLFSV